MKKRIFALIAVLAGAAAGIAVTADNYHWYKKAKEAENEGEWNLTTASELCERANIAHEQSYLLQKDMMDFAELSDADKEKVKALIRKLAREEKDGPDVPDMRQTEDGSADSKTEAEADGSADFSSESTFSDDTAPHDVAQATAENKDEEERLMAEYWRRAEKVYGHSDSAYGLAKNAKPVYHCNTGYAYISVADAAKKIGCPESYIRQCCDIPDRMERVVFSVRKKGGVFRYISQTEYAKLPKEQIEVETKDQRAEE